MGWLPDVSILIGDYNDTIWHAPCLNGRYRHPLLESSQLLDSVYDIHPLPSRTWHTRASKGLDVIVVSNAQWHVPTPLEYEISRFWWAGDHAPVIMHCTTQLPAPNHETQMPSPFDTRSPATYAASTPSSCDGIAPSHMTPRSIPRCVSSDMLSQYPRAPHPFL